MDPTSLTAAEQTKTIPEKKVTAVELLNAALERIEKADMHAFVHVCKEEALKKAEDVDRRIAADGPVGPLAGVVYSAADNYCTRAIPTTAGMKVLRGWEPPYSASVIKRLDQADAVLIGKTNCDGAGGAAAVAACQSAFALENDAFGSLRQSAASYGLVGLKPTYGRVSRYGICGRTSSMDTPGVITRTIGDAAEVLKYIIGRDMYDSTCRSIPAEDFFGRLQKSVKDLRIGISPDLTEVSAYSETGEYRTKETAPEIRKAMMKTAEVLKAAGARIIENIPMPNTKYAPPAAFVISAVETYSNLQRFTGLPFGAVTEKKVSDMHDLYFKTRGEGFDHETKLRLLTGLFASQEACLERYYRKAQQVRAMVREDYDRVFDPDGAYRLDILLTPALPLTAADFAADPLPRNTDYFLTPMDLAGVPAVTFPSCYDRAVGVQAVGPDFREDLILRTAYVCEQAFSDQGAAS